MPKRREILVTTATAGAFLALRGALGAAASVPGTTGFGALRPDPERILDLPNGFSYTIVSRAGAKMDDGLVVPGAHDGMAAFDAGNGRVALVCNHELDYEDVADGAFGGNASAAGPVYDAGHGRTTPGGTTTLIYDPASKKVERQFLSLAGTERNCAGGPTPWGSWLSCEESVAMPDAHHEQSHGWVFEVPAAATGRVAPVPLAGLGRFNHEAVAIDPRTGMAYLTEDQGNGLLYRFIPNEKGRLAAGGRLQALALADWTSADTRNPPDAKRRIPQNQPLKIRWIDLDNTDSPLDDLRVRGHAAGAAIFARGEGICHGPDGFYFACTSGGAIGAGQIFRYRPSASEGGADEAKTPGELDLFVESTDRRKLENCDNLTAAPWGDLVVCEDAKAPCALVGVTPDGGLYTFAENNYTDSELAGVCFAPDGRTLFVNIQGSGLTLAISGPFPA